MSFKLDSVPYKKQDLPTTRDEIVTVSKKLIDEVCTSWKKGKSYHYSLKTNPTLDSGKIEVKTYHTNRGREYWLSRVSEHHLDNSTYERLVKVLNGSEKKGTQWVLPDNTARSHAEKEYIETLNRVEILETTPSGWVGVNLEYEMGKPLTTREFNEWVYVVPPFQTADPNVETGLVVSVVADAPMRDPIAHTNAFYVSVESLDYNRESKKLVWKMATTSDAGGNVPKWIQNSMIAKTVSKDVSFMFEWLGDGHDNYLHSQ